MNSAVLEIQIVELHQALARIAFYDGTIMSVSYLNTYKKFDILVRSYKDKEKVKIHFQ